MRTDNAARVLDSASIRSVVFWASGSRTVYISPANQLLAEKRVFDSKEFRDHHPAYKGWEAHHIVEAQDLERLGISYRFPPYDQQICVLLPAGGHRGRINARLRAMLPIGLKNVTASDLINAYADAYSMLGDYCGGGEEQIAHELMSIVKQLAGIGVQK